MPPSTDTTTSPHEETAAPAGPSAGTLGVATTKLLNRSAVYLPDGLGFVVTLDAATGSEARRLLSPDYMPDACPEVVWRLIRPDGSAAAVGRANLNGNGNTLARQLRRYYPEALTESVALHVQQTYEEDFRWAWTESDDPPYSKRRHKDGAAIAEDYEHEVKQATEAVATIVADLVPHLPAETVAAANAARTANEDARAMQTPDADELIRQLAEERAYAESLRLKLDTVEADHAAHVSALKAAHAAEVAHLRRRSVMLDTVYADPAVQRLYTEETTHA